MKRTNLAREKCFLIVDRGDVLFPIEIKSGETISASYFSSLAEWNALSGGNPERSTVVYGGDKNQTRKCGKVLQPRFGS